MIGNAALNYFRKIIALACLIRLVQTHAYAQAEFVRNEGQWDTPYQFTARLSHGDFWVGKGKAFFMLSDFGNAEEEGGGQHPHGNISRARYHGYEMEFLGASLQGKLTGSRKLNRYHNYYTSRNSRFWRSGVALFSGTREQNIYPGTDLVWKEEGGSLKYEFELRPGADPGSIRIRYRGLDSVYLESGNLVLQTSLGSIREQKPLAWQTDRKGRKTMIPCVFHLHPDQTTSFEFPDGYDPRRPLTIDPILVFSSFSGSRSDNWGFTSTYGEESSPYAAGIALGPRFPVTPGAYDPSFGGDSSGFIAYSTYDIGVLKFNPSGTELLYATYLGGAEAEAPSSIVVDKDSCLIILGTSSSADFPVTESAFDTSYNGGVPVFPYGPGESGVQYRTGSDIVLSRFSKDGKKLLASTFLGGSANDGLLSLLEIGNSALVKNYGDSFRGEVICDSSGRIYIASNSLSTDFPVQNPVQAQPGGRADAVLAIFNTGLDSLLFSTYFGGTDDDAAYSLQFGPQGDLYFSGGTASSNFPVSSGTIGPAFSGAVDGYIARIRPGVSNLVRSTFLGTNQFDQSYFVQTDRAGNVYAYGQTTGNYPITPGVFSNPGSAQFIHCLSADLDTTRFSTVFGSGTSLPNISPTAFLVDDCGRIYCSGWGGSTNGFFGYQNGNTFNLPTTPGSGSQTTDGSDFYILVLEPNASGIVFGTYFGDAQSVGEHVDGGTSRFDKRGVIYQAVCAGCGGSSTFPTTPGVVSNINPSPNCNNALFVYDFSKLQARYSSASTGGCVPLTLKFKSVSVYDQQIKWDFDDGTVVFGNSQDSIAHTFNIPRVYRVKLVAFNPEGCPAKDSTIQFITVQQPVGFQGDTLEFCSSDTSISMPQLPEGDLTYLWEPASFLSSQVANPVQIIQPDSSVWYTATVTTSEGCKSSRQFFLRDRSLKARASSDTLQGCLPLSVNFASLSRNSANERWIFSPGDTVLFSAPNSSLTRTFGQAGLIPVILITGNDTSCALRDSDTLRIQVNGGPALRDTLLRYCADGALNLQVPVGSAGSFSWSPGGLLNDSLLASPDMPAAAPALFTLTAKDSLNGCISQSKIEVRDGRLKAVFVVDSIPLCAPVQVPLSGQSLNPVFSRYFWGSDSLTVAGNTPVLLSFSRGGRYTIRLKVLSDTACAASADTSLEISLGGPGKTGPENIPFCRGDSLLIKAAEGPGYTYSWPAGPFSFISPSQAFCFPEDSLRLLVRVRDSLLCEGESRFFLRPVRPDTAFSMVSEFDPCLDLLRYRASANQPSGNQYSWSILGDTVLAGNSWTYVFPERGTYRIRLRSRKEQCTDSSEQVLSVNDPPLNLKAGFDYRLRYSDCNSVPELEIINQSIGAERVIWQWNGQSSFAPVPQVNAGDADTLVLRLLAYQGFCLSEESKKIPVAPMRPPNLITLQEDGKNDSFIIPGLPEGCMLEIRDRWGKLILRDNAYRNTWKPEQEGVYFYQLRFPDGAGCRSWVQAVR